MKTIGAKILNASARKIRASDDNKYWSGDEKRKTQRKREGEINAVSPKNWANNKCFFIWNGIKLMWEKENIERYRFYKIINKNNVFIVFRSCVISLSRFIHRALIAYFNQINCQSTRRLIATRMSENLKKNARISILLDFVRWSISQAKYLQMVNSKSILITHHIQFLKYN